MSKILRRFKFLTDDERQKERLLKLCEVKNLSKEDLILICNTVTPHKVIECGKYKDYKVKIVKKYDWENGKNESEFSGKIILI